jgi:hypothetical protein
MWTLVLDSFEWVGLTWTAFDSLEYIGMLKVG